MSTRTQCHRAILIQLVADARGDPAFVAALERARGGHDSSARSGAGGGYGVARVGADLPRASRPAPVALRVPRTRKTYP